MSTSMPISPRGFPEFSITGDTTGEELECYRKNNSQKDKEGFLRSDRFDACVLQEALSTQNFCLIKHIIDLRPGLVNLELDSPDKEFDEKLGLKPLTPLSYAILLPGYGAQCDKTVLRIMTFLCARGANVNRFVDSMTPYTDLRHGNETPMYAAADRSTEKNREFVKTLLCFGACLPLFPPLPEDLYQKYQPENIYVADIPRHTISKVKKNIEQAWNALYAEHRNIYLVKFGIDNNSEFKGFPAEVLTHFVRASIQHCYKSNY